MDKIEKFLKKLQKNEQEVFILLMIQIKKDHTKVPGIIFLKGKKGHFRVRVGRYRLIFEVTETGIEIKKITKRDENTYRNL
ncbi:hypothetical protein KKG71_02550 [Patescibacteria group bacterium]|nr:hypothetical protein [Patescibacteria group bacterium]